MLSRSNALQSMSKVTSGLVRAFSAILVASPPVAAESEPQSEEEGEGDEPPLQGPLTRSARSQDPLKPERVQ